MDCVPCSKRKFSGETAREVWFLLLAWKMNQNLRLSLAEPFYTFIHLVFIHMSLQYQGRVVASYLHFQSQITAGK